MALTQTEPLWITPPRNTGMNIARPMEHPIKLNLLTTTIWKVFMRASLRDKEDHEERRTKMAGMVRHSIRTNPTGVRAPKTNNTKVTQRQQLLNLAMVNHQRVPIPLNSVVTSPLELRARVTLHSVLKIPMTLLAVRELFFCQLEPFRTPQTNQPIHRPRPVVLSTQSSCPTPKAS